MALSIAEKQHWKDRIETKINRRIQDIKLSDQNHFDQIKSKARKMVAEDFGVTASIDRLTEIEDAQKGLEEERNQLLRSVREVLTGSQSWGYYSRHDDVNQYLDPHVQRKQKDLLKASKLGRVIIELEAEKENLLDTIWLATSPRQMAGMWSKFLTLIGENITDFQKEILRSKEIKKG